MHLGDNMNNNLPRIYFYIPASDWSDEIPTSNNNYWSGFSGNITSGVYCWTIQTYLNLKADGLECEITKKLPEEGIVFAHRLSLPFYLKPKPKLLIICLKADYDRHPMAQLHIVINKAETKNITNSYYIAHWPQPGLIPRDTYRGDKFENIAYIGIEKNLAPELQQASWQEEIKKLGLQWHIVDRDRWHDFSYIDAIIAVRSFKPNLDYSYKPATKLYNAWNANVPAILGCESAFRNERKNELDYLEVTSVEETILALKRLRDDKKFRQAMVENGRIRAEATKPSQVIIQWRNFLENIAIPAYINWCNSTPLQQKIYLAQKYLAIKENGLKPQPIYAQDNIIKDQEHINIFDKIIIASIQLYRKAKRILKNIK